MTAPTHPPPSYPPTTPPSQDPGSQHPHPPPPHHPPPPPRPYTGDYAGATWNAQALFAHNTQKQKTKQAHAAKLLHSHDFVLLQETHSVPGTTQTYSPPAGSRYFASHLTKTVGGVGILVKQSFLERFDPIPPEDDLTPFHWEEIQPGRIACLHLRGPEGNLDLMVVYMQTGQAKSARDTSRARVAQAVRPPHAALTIIAGDFNYTVRGKDRFCKATGRWSSEVPVTCEELAFRNIVADPFQLYELEQEDFTHDCAVSRSKLDRVYINQDTTYQLDRRVGCAALDWVPGVSAHRPVTFYRRTRAKAVDPDSLPLPTAPMRHPDWRRRVTLRLGELEREDRQDSQPIRRLLLLKRAVREVTTTMQQEMGQQPPETPQDRLGYTMRFLRAIEGHRWHVARRITEAYPRLAEFVDVQDRALHLHPGLQAVRDHAMELARTTILDDLREFQQQQPDLPDSVRTARRQALNARIARLRPGAATSIKAVQQQDGEITTNPGHMAQALRAHWERTFTRAPIDVDALQAWLRDTVPRKPAGHPQALPPTDSDVWDIRRRDIAKAIRLSNNSSPGPDGIPYLAWRALGRVGVDYLYEAAACLTTDDGPRLLSDAFPDLPEGDHDYNLGLLCCLPKKPTGATPDGDDYYSPDATRPLTIVNCDNRLVASAARFRWEEILAAWISPMQRGFLSNRSMLANVVDVDFQAMRVSLKSNRGALILFDFKAAFPSVSHEFILESLRHLGMPRRALNLVRCLYHSNRCQLSLLGNRYPGFEITAGIRQGCPLSPLLFITVVDSLLRCLKAKIHKAFPRAYADDTALVIRDLFRDLPTVRAIFDDFARVSGLRLNIPKTLIIPLGDWDPDQVAQALNQANDPWKEIQCAHHGTYLGFVVGPGKGNRSWEKPLQKAKARVPSWPWTTLGLHYSATVYNTYVLPTLTFVAQLERPPLAAKRQEEDTLAKIAVGPNNWFQTKDMFLLEEAYGLPYRFRSLAHTALAAQLRVAMWEDGADGGLRVREQAEYLRSLLARHREDDRRWDWNAWYHKSFILQLERTLDLFQRMGVTPESMLREFTDDAPRPWDKQTMQRAKRATQRRAYQHLMAYYQQHAWARMHKKLCRWYPPEPPPHITSVVLERLRALRPLVAPRVHTAVFSTLWNRWMTKHRFQVPGVQCLFSCCQPQNEDALEHYLQCPVVCDVAQRRLRLHLPHQHARQYLTLGEIPDNNPDLASWFIRCAVLLYAVYRTHNAARHRGRMTPAVAAAAIRQAIYEGTRGHPRSMRCVDAVYAA